MPMNFPDAPALNDQWVAPNGATYVWDGTKWTLISVASPPPPLAEPVGAGTWGRLETAAWERSVAVGGDTMTGGLTSAGFMVSAAAGTGAGLTLDRAAGQLANVVSATAGVSRWQIWLADDVAETGTNTGSNFTLVRFTDAGAVIDNPLTISRATGDVTLAGTGILYSGVGATQTIALAYDTVNMNVPIYIGGTSTSWLMFSALNDPNLMPIRQINLETATGLMWAYGPPPNIVTWGPITWSDRRLKTDIASASGDALGIINQLAVYSSTLTPPLDGAVPQHWDFSLMADEVGALIPPARVQPNHPDAYDTIYELPIIATMIKAMQQMTARIAALEVPPAREA